jgi:hypothetical protein
MRIADMSTGVSQLCDALETLQIAWAETKESWSDANSRNLEEHHLKPLAVEVGAAYPVVLHLASVLAQAERDCGPWS